MNGVLEKKVVLITCQNSIVVRGIENKLKELGCTVLTVGDDTSDIEGYKFMADLFIYYLPAEDPDELRIRLKHDFVRVIDVFSDKKLILIGENKNYDQYLKAVPSIRDKIWIDRPIDYSQLEYKVITLLQDKDRVPVKRSILIVDDDPVYARMVGGWIGDQYKINIVTAGMQAIKFLAKNKPDLILLDYEMPVADGPQVLGMIRSDPELSDIPVVFLTGINSRESIERVLSLKPSGYILKNTTKENLLNTLKGLFAKM